MQNDCGELMIIRNAQLGTGTILGLSAILYLLWLGYGLRRGRRQFGGTFSWGKVIHLALFGLVLIGWWLLWHTDILLTKILNIYPCCGYAVTVRAVIPWPTAFVWISWGLTAWLVAGILVAFMPKVKTQAG